MGSKPDYGTELSGTFVPLARASRKDAPAENNRHCVQPTLSHPHRHTQRPSRSYFEPESDTHPCFFSTPIPHKGMEKRFGTTYIYTQVLAKRYDTYFFGLQKDLVRLRKMSADQKTLVFTQDLTMPLYWVYFHQKLSSKIKFAVKMNSKTTLTTAF